MTTDKKTNMLDNNKNTALPGWLLLLAVFVFTNAEWNFISWYLKVAPFDIFALAGILLVLAVLCFDIKDLKSKGFIIFTGGVAAIAIYWTVVVHALAFSIYTVIAYLFIYVACKIKLNKLQIILVSVWLGFFFTYWTIDVKGYFKGYDVYYGSIILFLGFVFSFIIIEYFKYYLSAVYSGNNAITKFLGKHNYLISFLQALMLVWAYKIMMWYQSKMAFVFSVIFVGLMILPIDYYGIGRKIKSLFTRKSELKAEVSNYFANLSICGAIAFLVMFACSRDHLELISAPFVLGFLCLFGICNGAVANHIGDNYHVFNTKEHRARVKKTWRSKALVGLVATLTLLMPVIILSPLENYYTNLKDFTFACSDFFIPFLFIAIAVTVLVMAVCVIIRKDSARLLCTLIFSLGVTTYIQVMFLNRKLTESNGSKLDMESLGNYPKVNFVVWLVIFVTIIVVLYVLKDKWKETVLFVGGALTVMQLVAAVSLPFSFITKDRTVSYELTANDEMEVAKDENIIVFVLDSVGTVMYDNALAEFPDMMDGFEDFIFYDNADCSYAWTMPSMTHMLTGADVDFDAKSLFDWQYEAWNSDKVKNYYDRLHEAGYKTGLYTGDISYTFGDGENLYGKFDNAKSFEHIVDRKGVCNRMFKFSMLKTLPYVLKGRFLTNTDDFDGMVSAVRGENDLIANFQVSNFYDRLSEVAINEDISKAVKVIHLTGAHHASVTLDENLEKIEGATDNQKVCGNFRTLKIYLDKLQELGLYDNSTIIITADHGTHIGIADPQVSLFVKYKNQRRGEILSAEEIAEYDADASQESAKGALALKHNHAPVSHNDLLPTILREAGLDYADYGVAYADIPEDEVRERTTAYLSVDQDVYNFYTYTGDRDEILKKFPDSPDYTKEALK